METNEKLFTAYKNAIIATAEFFREMTDDLSARFERYNDYTDGLTTFHSEERVEAEDDCVREMKRYGLEFRPSRWQQAIETHLFTVGNLTAKLDDDLRMLEEQPLTRGLKEIYLNPDLRWAKRIGGKLLERVWFQAVDHTVGSVDEMIK